jgi:hypothetical protein
MSMIRPAKFSLDHEDNVIDTGILDTKPFPVTYKQTNWPLPNFASVTNLAELTPDHSIKGSCFNQNHQSLHHTSLSNEYVTCHGISLSKVLSLIKTTIRSKIIWSPLLSVSC